MTFNYELDIETHSQLHFVFYPSIKMSVDFSPQRCFVKTFCWLISFFAQCSLVHASLWNFPSLCKSTLSEFLCVCVCVRVGMKFLLCDQCSYHFGIYSFPWNSSFSYLCDMFSIDSIRLRLFN